jgi:hypothetical protein
MTRAFPNSVFQPAGPPPAHHHRRRITRLDHAMAAMRQGRTLNLQLDDSSAPLWSLSDGAIVPAGIAASILLSASIGPVGRATSPGQPAWAWRMAP